LDAAACFFFTLPIVQRFFVRAVFASASFIPVRVGTLQSLSV
jgi:hypothetical protein